MPAFLAEHSELDHVYHTFERTNLFQRQGKFFRGLVIDFKMIKPIVREIVNRLDEHWIIPGEHPVLTAKQRSDGVWEVRYLERYYAAPAEDVIILPINNTSSENLAAWIGRELRSSLNQHFPDIELNWLRLAVEETSGQHGVYEFTRDESPNSDPS